MRVLWVTPWFPTYPGDGQFNFILHPVEALLRRGHDVRVAVALPIGTKGPQHEAFPALDLVTIRYPRIPRMIALEASLRTWQVFAHLNLGRVVDAFKPDVVHAHTEWTAHAVVPLAAFRQIPVVVSLHAADVTRQIVSLARRNSRLRRTLRQANRVLAVGTPVLRYLEELDARPETAVVVPNGFFVPDDFSSPLPRDWTAPLQIRSLGVLTEAKAYDTALRALSELAARGVSFSFDHVGDGFLYNSLTKAARVPALAGKIRFFGRLDHSEALRTVATGHVFVHPARREAFGVAALEASALGLVPIAVQGQGPADFIQDGINGVLVPPDDPTALADALHSLDRDRDRLAQLAHSAHLSAQRLTWDQHALRLEAVYEEVRSSGVR